MSIFKTAMLMTILTILLVIAGGLIGGEEGIVFAFIENSAENSLLQPGDECLLNKLQNTLYTHLCKHSQLTLNDRAGTARFQAGGER